MGMKTLNKEIENIAEARKGNLLITVHRYPKTYDGTRYQAFFNYGPSVWADTLTDVIEQLIITVGDGSDDRGWV